jgi:WD40 repeat protein
VAFSPDGRLLVTSGHQGGRHAGHFQVWDFPALTVRTNFSVFAFDFASAVFTPDSKQLLTGDEIGRLLLWDVAEGRVVDILHPHTGGISTITFSRDGRTMATSSGDRTLVVWDWLARTPLVRLRGHLGEVQSAAISPDGQMLASGSADGTIRLFDTGTRHDERCTLPGCGLIIGFSANSRLLVVRGFKDIRSWRLQDGAETTLPLDIYQERGLSPRADLHGIKPYAVFGMTNGDLEHWNLETMSRIASWQVHEGEVVTAVFSPDGRFIATSGTNGDVIVWDAKTHNEVSSFTPRGRELICLTFSPDGRLLAGAEGTHRDPRVCIWDVNEGSLLHKLDGFSGLELLAFSPDGKLLATAHDDNNARIWEIPSGKLKATLKGHVSYVVGVAFSPDGKTLATGGYDRKVKLWNIATQQELTTLELLPGGCLSLRFSPDGRALAAGSLLSPEPYMSLWQVPSFEEIAAAEAARRTEN